MVQFLLFFQINVGTLLANVVTSFNIIIVLR